MLDNNLDLVDNDTLVKRNTICNTQCLLSSDREDPINNYCELCHCHIPTKIKYKNKKCPLNKW